MRKKEEEGESLASLASQALERIRELSESQKISDKLQSLSILLFVFVATLAITEYLGGSFSEPFSLGVLIVVSAILALIVSLGYAPILDIVSNVSPNKVEALRVGISVLFIALTIAVAGLAFKIMLLSNLALGLVGLQLIMIPIGGFLFPKISIKDTEIEPNQIWIAIGRVASILGIVSFLIDLVLIILKSL